MKLIQVLGPGCPKCDKLLRNAQQAVQRVGVEASVEKVTDIDRIIRSGVIMTPALIVDGVVKSVGKVLSVDEIQKFLVETPGLQSGDSKAMADH